LAVNSTIKNNIMLSHNCELFLTCFSKFYLIFFANNIVLFKCHKR